MLFRSIHPFVRFARIFEIESGEQYPPFIPRDCRLFYAVKGQIHIQTKEKLYSLTPTDCLLIPEGTVYQTMNNCNQNAQMLALNFDFTFAYSHLTNPIPPEIEGTNREIELLSTPLIEDAPQFHHPLFLANRKEGEFYMRDIISAFELRLTGYEISMSANLMHLLTHFCNSETSGNSLAQEVIRYINQHYQAPLTNQALGKHFGYHPNYISNVVKKSTGLPLHAYLNNLRISRAISMLESGNLTISQVAYQVGFSDLGYFSRYFKKMTGVAPSAFFK
ncbi:MAG: helix-turn-helix domain-containing protein [Ruminococcaceae bacterium]|nr:helix-turn-helix domain-containing protein [Oscillospiraceae bacterium]